MTNNLARCPKCYGISLAVEVKTWITFEDGEPATFDDEDLPYAKPVIGGEVVCRSCQHIFNVEVK